MAPARYASTSTYTDKLPRAATPEEVGISSKALLNLLDEFDKQNLEYHGLMILRHGKVAFEIYRKPYAAEIPHSIYSFSKSVAATAIGFAIDEGLLTLDTKVMDLFPEYRTKKQADKRDSITIHHIMSMTSGLSFNVFHKNSSPDWVKDYLHSNLRDEPGTVYHYTNECAYILSVIIHRLTGQTMFEYLKPRLFDPLGIEVPYSETDAQGRQAGGWGIYWKLEDSAKFMQCYLNNGLWNGKQVIPAWWTEEATKAQSENPENCKADSCMGYGYQFWMCALPNTFAARGMFCQQGIGMRDYDAVFCYFGADADEQKPLDVIYPHFPAGFLDKTDTTPADPAVAEELRRRAQTLSFPNPPVSPRQPAAEKKLENRVIHLRKQLLLNLTGYPQGFLPMPVNQMAIDRAGNITDIALDFGEDEVHFSWREGDWKNSLPLGLDGRYRTGKVCLSGFEFDTYGWAQWEDERTILLHIRPIQTCISRSFRIRLRAGGRVKVSTASTPSFRSIADNLMKLSYAFLNHNPFMCFLSRRIFGVAPSILESNLYGRLKRRKAT